MSNMAGKSNTQSTGATTPAMAANLYSFRCGTGGGLVSSVGCFSDEMAGWVVRPRF